MKISLKWRYKKEGWLLTVDICYVFFNLQPQHFSRSARSLLSAKSYEPSCNTYKDYSECERAIVLLVLLVNPVQFGAHAV